jgi:hypothetical protein
VSSNHTPESETPEIPDPLAPLGDLIGVYSRQTDPELAAIVRHYAIAPDSLDWLARGALLAEIADRLDPGADAPR